LTPWEVEWTDRAIASLRAIPYHHASSIVRAVDRFALTGRGRTYRGDEDDAATLRLRVGSYRV
jgi:mRNA-degrading endonuclease RelE of RelBE toxin-antitoxin system